jgi:hypothetical protein
MSNHVGYISPPGVIAAGLTEKAIRDAILATRPHMRKERVLTPAQAAALEAASGESGFAYRIRTVKGPPAKHSLTNSAKPGRP